MAGILPPVSLVFKVVAKKAYFPVSDENDELLIQNLGAIKYGLDALLKEDAKDFDEAMKLWKEAKRLLIEENENEIGTTAQGSIDVSDDFHMEAFPVGI